MTQAMIWSVDFDFPMNNAQIGAKRYETCFPVKNYAILVVCLLNTQFTARPAPGLRAREFVNKKFDGRFILQGVGLCSVGLCGKRPEMLHQSL